MSMSLKALRVNANLKQYEVADAMDITINTLKNYENFKTIPNVETAIRFAEYYNTTVDDIRWIEE